MATDIIREGKKIQLVDLLLSAGDTVTTRARALLLEIVSTEIEIRVAAITQLARSQTTTDQTKPARRNGC